MRKITKADLRKENDELRAELKKSKDKVDSYEHELETIVSWIKNDKRDNDGMIQAIMRGLLFNIEKQVK